MFDSKLWIVIITVILLPLIKQLTEIKRSLSASNNCIVQVIDLTVTGCQFLCRIVKMGKCLPNQGCEDMNQVGWHVSCLFHIPLYWHISKFDKTRKTSTPALWSCGHLVICVCMVTVYSLFTVRKHLFSIESDVFLQWAGYRCWKLGHLAMFVFCGYMIQPVLTHTHAHVRAHIRYVSMV